MTQYPGSGKSLVVAISPQTDVPIDSNVGGYFGPLLKFSGFDAIELQGKADRDVILVIDGQKGIIRVEEAPEEPADSHIAGRESSPGCTPRTRPTAATSRWSAPARPPSTASSAC